jgi:ribosomal protein S18 acetylase RimI-like enzyme
MIVDTRNVPASSHITLTGPGRPRNSTSAQFMTQKCSSSVLNVSSGGPEHTKSSRTASGRHTNARRASHRLKHHSNEMFGREYAMFSHSVSLREVRKTVAEAYALSGMEPVTTLNNWILEPLQLPHKDLIDVSLSINWHSLNDVLKNRGGVLFGIKTKPTKLVEDKLEACAIFREYDPTITECVGLGPFKRFSSLPCRSCAFLQTPNQTKNVEGSAPVMSAKKKTPDIDAFERRVEYIEEKLIEWHTTYGPATSHWHLTDISVLPEAQNQGFGTELMTTFQRLADHYKTDCYLECEGTRNAAFFLRSGFIVAGEENLALHESPRDTPSTTLYFMIRCHAHSS